MVVELLFLVLGVALVLFAVGGLVVALADL